MTPLCRTTTVSKGCNHGKTASQSFSLMAVYFTLESSHRMLVTLWFGSYMVGFPANLWEVYHPIPFPPHRPWCSWPIFSARGLGSEESWGRAARRIRAWDPCGFAPTHVSVETWKLAPPAPHCHGWFWPGVPRTRHGATESLATSARWHCWNVVLARTALHRVAKLGLEIHDVGYHWA